MQAMPLPIVGQLNRELDLDAALDHVLQTVSQREFKSNDATELAERLFRCMSSVVHQRLGLRPNCSRRVRAFVDHQLIQMMWSNVSTEPVLARIQAARKILNQQGKDAADEYLRHWASNIQDDFRRSQARKAQMPRPKSRLRGLVEEIVGEAQDFPWSKLYERLDALKGQGVVIAVTPQDIKFWGNPPNGDGMPNEEMRSTGRVRSWLKDLRDKNRKK